MTAGAEKRFLDAFRECGPSSKQVEMTFYSSRYEDRKKAHNTSLIGGSRTRRVLYGFPKREVDKILQKYPHVVLRRSPTSLTAAFPVRDVRDVAARSSRQSRKRSA